MNRLRGAVLALGAAALLAGVGWGIVQVLPSDESSSNLSSYGPVSTTGAPNALASPPPNGSSGVSNPLGGGPGGPPATVPPAVDNSGLPTTTIQGGDVGLRAPFPDSGDPAVIATLKQVVPTRMTDQDAVLSLPADPAARKQYAAAVLAGTANAQATAAGITTPPGADPTAVAVINTLNATWDTSLQASKLTALREQMNAAVADPNFSGFSAARFRVDSWLGVRVVNGSTAYVSLTGVESIDRSTNAIARAPAGWISYNQRHYDLTLTLQEGVWKITSEASQRTDGQPGW
jgi:hypothetical protein